MRNIKHIIAPGGGNKTTDINELLNMGLREKRQITDNIYCVKGGGGGLELQHKP
jgi:hypothetical protein